MSETTRSVLPPGHPQHDAVKAEAARLRDLAAELEVDPVELAAQTVVHYRQALTAMRKEVNALRTQVYGRYAS
jgi:putative heme degradation protein